MVFWSYAKRRWNKKKCLILKRESHADSRFRLNDDVKLIIASFFDTAQ